MNNNSLLFIPQQGDEAPVPEDGIKPTFTERPVIRQTEDGAKIIFECRCVGKPAPTVTWFNGDGLVEEGGRYTITLENDQTLYYIARLEINNVVTGDRGEYRAIARNQYGEGVSTINLNFESADKPK